MNPERGERNIVALDRILSYFFTLEYLILAMNWNFWIDVGGTFTDCIAKTPEGEIVRAKVLSSGLVNGTVAQDSSSSFIIDADKRPEPKGFYDGYLLRVFDLKGQFIDEAKVEAYEAGKFKLETPLDKKPETGFRIELKSGEVAPVLGIRKLMGIGLSTPIGPVNIRLGTTHGTNALLERKGAPTALVITEGFGDLIQIGNQSRPELFNLQVRRPEMLYKEVVEVNERMDKEGNVLKELNAEALRKSLVELKGKGIDSVAILFINAYKNPIYEEKAKQIAEKIGFEQVSISSEMSATIKAVDRGDTALIDAYLTPVIRDFIKSLRKTIPDADLRLMTSAGGLVNADHFSGKDCILSGPAGGVVGFSTVAKLAGFEKALGFDMGGTSTDVCRFGGEYEYQFSCEKEGVRIVAPMYAIETVAAGGGSICRFDGQKLVVGPESAGAHPGPACYGKGGPLTITDINLFNGKVSQKHFPFQLKLSIVEDRLREVQAQVLEATGESMSLEQIADGFTKIANHRMAQVIKRISSSKGYNPVEHVLVSFGGAGAQHACSVARLLGTQKVLLHPMAGILSALGMGFADIRRFKEQSLLTPFDGNVLDELATTLDGLETQLRIDLSSENILEESLSIKHLFDIRYQGEEAVITLTKDKQGISEQLVEEVTKEFQAQHQQLYGHSHKGRGIELVNVRVEMVGHTHKPEFPTQKENPYEPEPLESTKIHFDGKPFEAPIYERERLTPGAIIQGPAMILEEISTIVVEPGWTAKLTERFDLVLTDENEEDRHELLSTKADPVYLELFNNHFSHIAEQMGVTLQKISLSVNVKERLDFSCAILDAQGNLVVNAPHIPVHLGAMGECVKGLLEMNIAINLGDVFICNDPSLGGTHLPDITIISPVFGEDNQLRFFVASRAHHSEIGGLKPGSIYPFAKNLEEEGVVFRHMNLVQDGVFQEESLLKALTEAKYPSRSPQENIADIKAQMAANQIGITELERMIAHYSWPVVEAYMGHIRTVAEEKTRQALRSFASGVYSFSDTFDNGAPVQLKLTIQDDHLTVDFTGSAPVQPNSLNANEAIVKSALLYCLRCLIGENIPMNAGMFAPVELILPEGMLNPPRRENPAEQAAVVAGNVEVSQKVTDVILGALGVASASQGTMNNFVFGNDNFGYYETIGGGVGATQGYDGESAIHSHMTNTRITDVEILEARFPVRVHQFGIRQVSGGQGKFKGGNGIVRELEFLEPVEVSLLTQRRNKGAFGLNGGKEGKAGENFLYTDGNYKKLEGLEQLSLKKGERILMKTPGGGGFGNE